MQPLVLVTGGAGFIGSYTVERLLDQGYQVRVYDTLVEQVHGGGGPRFVPPGADFIHADIRDRSALRQALQGVQGIVHLAAEVGVGQSMYEIVRYVDANTLGTATLLEILANEAHQVEKIVVASSMTIYGEGAYYCTEHGEVFPPLRSEEQMARHDWELHCPSCDLPVTSVPTREGKLPAPASIYATTKLDQELMCLAVGQAYGISVTALRYFNAYGPRQALSNPYTGVSAMFSGRMLNGRPPIVFEDGRQSRDFVHVTDVARANVLALEADHADGQVFNIGTGQPTTILEIAQVLAERLGVNIAPDLVGQYRPNDVRHCTADISRAREVLGFQPLVDFESGMTELVAWVREQTAVDRLDAAHAEMERRGLARSGLAPGTS